MTHQRSTTWRAFGAAWTFAALVLVAESTPGVAVAEDAPPAPIGPPHAGQYQLDKAHVSVLFRVSHMGFSTYTSRFSRVDAQLTFDPENLAASKLTATIDSSSVEMAGAPAFCLDIVHGPKLLDTTKFPEITFRSERVRVKGSNALEVTGQLTLHGVTRPLVLTGTYNGGYASQPLEKNARIGFSAQGSLNRSDFGMTFGLPAPGTKMGLGDTIEISIEAEFLGPPLAASPAK
jgi:polyisoprenoid-binding protein YceI